MRNRLFSGWLGPALLSLWFLSGPMIIFSGTTIGNGASLAVAQEPGAAEKPAGAFDKPPESESLLHWLYRSLGLRYVIIFLFITFNLAAVMVMNVLAVRRDAIVPAALVQSFEAFLNEKRYQEAYEMAKNDESFLGRVLAAGMAKLAAGYDEALAAMQEAGEEENMKLEQRLGWVQLCAQVGPMFGLLGTVDGMVIAFDVISKTNVTPKPNELAQGIGMALVTTVVGLWIAIPAIAFHHIVKNRIAKLLLEAGVISEELMKRFRGQPASAAAAPKKQ